MDSKEVTEKQSDVLTREIIERYTQINDIASELMASLSTKRDKPSVLNRLSKEMKPLIIGIVGIAQTKDKFYAEIEPFYIKYTNKKIGSFRSARYNAESTLEMWEITKKLLVYHNVIELTGE